MPSIVPPASDSKGDYLTPAMRELADGIAQYVEAFMSCVDSLAELRAVDFQYMADDFVDSCVVGIMQVDGGEA